MSRVAGGCAVLRFFVFFLRPPVARDASNPGDCHDPRAGDATISKVRRGSKCGSRFTASPGELRKVIAPSFRWVQRQCATPKCNPGYTKSHPGNTRATHKLHLVSAEGYAHVARGLRPVVPWSQQNYTHVHPGYTRPRLGYMKVSPRLHPRHARVMPESWTSRPRVTPGLLPLPRIYTQVTPGLRPGCTRATPR